MDVINPCEQLLKDHKAVYEQHTRKLTEYKQALELHRQEQLRLRQQQNPQALAQYAFNQSNFVEYNGAPYDCSKNQSALSCTTASSIQHRKCKCQQLFLSGRSHLNAPCNATGNQFSPALTEEQCQAWGLLDNHGMENELFYGQSIPLEQDSPATKLTHFEYALNEPVKPVLIFPTVTCVSCAKEFHDLQSNYSLENIVQIQNCIRRLQSGDGASADQPITALRTAPDELPNKNSTPDKQDVEAQSLPSSAWSNSSSFMSRMSSPFWSNFSSNSIYTWLLLAFLVLAVIVLAYKVYFDYCACCEADKHMNHHHHGAHNQEQHHSNSNDSNHADHSIPSYSTYRLKT